MMNAYFRKEIHAFEYETFTELEVKDGTTFCCDGLENYPSVVDSWSSKIGKFCITEKDVLVPINYCPFCGEKIEYVSVK